MVSSFTSEPGMVKAGERASWKGGLEQRFGKEAVSYGK